MVRLDALSLLHAGMSPALLNRENPIMKNLRKVTDWMVASANQTGLANEAKATGAGIMVHCLWQAVKGKQNMTELYGSICIDPLMTKSGLNYISQSVKKTFELCIMFGDDPRFIHTLQTEGKKIRRSTKKDHERQIEALAEEAGIEGIPEENINAWIDARVSDWTLVPNAKGRTANPNLSKVNKRGADLLNHDDNLTGIIRADDVPEAFADYQGLIEDLSLLDGEPEVTTVAFVRNIGTALESVTGQQTDLRALKHSITAPSADNAFSVFEAISLPNPTEVRVRHFDGGDDDE